MTGTPETVRGNAAPKITGKGEMCENECAPERRANAARDDLLAVPSQSRKGAVAIMMPNGQLEQPRSGNERADDAATIRRLQSLLALAIEARDELLRRGMDNLPEVDKHWFVPEAPDGYHCAACNLPERNGRHVSRRAA
jgi:hypothetical protein